jgi:hypothetical protein
MHDAAPLSSQLPMQARPAGVGVDCACCDRAAFVGKFFALRLCYQGETRIELTAGSASPDELTHSLGLA